MKKMMKQKLVLIPGVGGDERLWQFQIKHLADIADIVVPDLSKCSSRKAMTDVVLRSVEGKFALAGVSMGGWIGFAVAVQAPERVTKFAAIGTWARTMPDTEKQQREILNNIKNGGFEEFLKSYCEYSISHAKRKDKEFVDLLKNDASRVKEEVMINHLQAYLDDFDSQVLLPKISCPTLVIAGRNDPIFSVEEHEYIAQSVKGARLAIIDDCAHFIPFERPQALSSLLRYWLMYF